MFINSTTNTNNIAFFNFSLAERFRRFSLSEIKERGYKLDVTWLKDESLEDGDDLPEPQELATAAAAELAAVVAELQSLVALLDAEETAGK